MTDAQFFALLAAVWLAPIPSHGWIANSIVGVVFIVASCYFAFIK